MARTTSALVQGIVITQSGVDLTPFITWANLITTAYCTYIAPGSNPVEVDLFAQGALPYADGAPNTQMEVIERYLAAHAYSIFDPQLTFAKAGSAAVGFQYKVDYDLRITPYGQQAIMLDIGQRLARWNNSSKEKKRYRIYGFWAGKRRHWGWDGDARSDTPDVSVAT